MQNKIKKLSLIALVIGVGIMPTGLIINNYLETEVSKGVPEALLGIQENMVPEIEQMVNFSAIPEVLLGIYDEGFPFIHYLVNLSFLTGVCVEMNNSILGADLTFELFFNFPTFNETLSALQTIPYKGVSEYITNSSVSLNYTTLAEKRLIYGNESLGIPGFMEDPEVGWGVLKFLDLYQNATLYTSANISLQENYNATWFQISALVEWMEDHFLPIAIPNILSDVTICPPEYWGLTTVDIANLMFYDQWANGSMGELNIGELLGLSSCIVGFEAGCPVPLNLSLATTIDLWNSKNIFSFTNTTIGLQKWIEAANGNSTIQTELSTTFNLDLTQFSIILDWLFNKFKKDVVPPLFEYEQGMTIPEYAVVLFFEQWANGTLRGDALYPDGIDLGEELGLGFSLTGFEAGIPVPTGILLSTAMALFDKENTLALVNTKGLQKWYLASSESSSDAYNELKSYFNLTDNQMLRITTWLVNFRDKVVPFLAQYEMGLATDPLTLGINLEYGLTISGLTLFFIGLIVYARSQRKIEE
ncbi:MAG: hypothetical protein ACFFBI_00290 [Promethearchaeota archaeon]